MIQELNLQENDQEIHILVIRSARKSLGLEVRDQNTVLARIPVRLPDRELKQFVETHREWILKKTQIAAQREENRKATPAPPLESLSKTDRMKIQLKIGKRVRHYCEIMGVKVGWVTVKNQKTRWGSCSSAGNLNFNWRLIFAPPAVLDYVVVHELAHRKEMNHSAAFYAIVEQVLPDYRSSQKWLRENGHQLWLRK